MDLDRLVGVMCIDLRKAFDTVDHGILCRKVDLYSVHQRELSWFKSYLSGRKQFCRVNGVDSTLGNIEVGVPKDLVLVHFSFSFTSMISHRMSRNLTYPCMLMIPVCATSPTI